LKKGKDGNDLTRALLIEIFGAFHKALYFVMRRGGTIDTTYTSCLLLYALFIPERRSRAFCYAEINRRVYIGRREIW